jgi:hypothetical protein
VKEFGMFLNIMVVFGFPERTSISSSDADSVVSISSGDEDIEVRSGKPKTTMMLRNIPNSFTRAMLADTLDKAGFRGSYDFVYLPIDHSTNIGFGYAFVNFTSPSGAQTQYSCFTGGGFHLYGCLRARLNIMALVPLQYSVLEPYHFSEQLVARVVIGLLTGALKGLPFT